MIKETGYDAVFDGQRHFRVLLDAMARPGMIGTLNDVTLSPQGLNQASALVGFALLNADVSFHVASGKAEPPAYLTMNTASRPTDPEQADFLFADGAHATDAVRRAKVGTLTYPENGATVVIDVDRLATEPIEGSLTITLRGPGVDGEVTVHIVGLSREFFEALKVKNDEFPLGVDTIIADRQGAVLCIPRTSKVTV